ncbi:helix-turn-helix domain-containing protein [Actinoplanes teichomyceticus]|uniref:Helix-turn-helix protein n=1 Tax=Actinoplanes teichomyceticus TaxID=1867 RepID=A0A561WBZ3_ACTTI|nr:helix-turn-helix transcriptional regulator [Actinoplanes teichomyceticus]TWG21388.1 helix-turn-helix protein [Actinoplanes teichomyceticus]GIF17189.1 hypothetical protein Ate01nite_72210 [Actinoplanes teichomyceticus]
MPKKHREPADPGSSPIAAFGFDLRLLRQQASLSYTAIAQASFFSKSAIHSVDQGHHLPSVSSLKAFVDACGDDPQPWIARRAVLAAQLAASKESPEKLSPREQGLPAPAPTALGTAAEFNDGLKRLREWSGLTYRMIAARSTPGARVAPSTLCGAFARGTLPRRNLTASFLQAIGLPDADQQAWLDAWQAIKDGQPVRVAAPAPLLPTVQDLLGAPPSDTISSNPWTTHRRARLILQSCPPPETTGLAATPHHGPDHATVPPPYEAEQDLLGCPPADAVSPGPWPAPNGRTSTTLRGSVATIPSSHGATSTNRRCPQQPKLRRTSPHGGVGSMDCSGNTHSTSSRSCWGTSTACLPPCGTSPTG